MPFQYQEKIREKGRGQDKGDCLVKGIVSRVRYSREGCSCTLTDGKNDYSFFTEDSVGQGSAVVVEGEIKEGKIDASAVITLSGKEAEQAYQDTNANLKHSLTLSEGPALVKDPVTEKLWPMLKDAALELLCAKRLGRNIVLRFHGDADGIAGAFALTEIIRRAKAFQQNAAIYNVRDALRDISTAGQEGRPLVILLDFASNDDSQEAVNLLKAAGIDVMIIDHHPMGEKNREVINPLLLAENSSQYTAGYLACEIAVACGMDIEKGKELARIACTGDKSNIIEHDDEDVKKAMVLDYLAAHINFGNNLEFYQKVMNNDELFSSIAQQARDSIEEAADKAMKGMNTKKNKVEIASFGLDNVVTKGEWPNAGKITTCIFERLKKDEALVCIGHTERSLIIRLNDGAAKLGLSANQLAKDILQSMPDFVEGGGGHVKAGAIRVRKGFAKDVLGELIRAIESK